MMAKTIRLKDLTSEEVDKLRHYVIGFSNKLRTGGLILSTQATFDLVIEELPGGYWGHYESLGEKGILSLNPNLASRYARSVIRHELGHIASDRKASEELPPDYGYPDYILLSEIGAESISRGGDRKISPYRIANIVIHHLDPDEDLPINMDTSKLGSVWKQVESTLTKYTDITPMQISKARSIFLRRAPKAWELY